MRFGQLHLFERPAGRTSKEIIDEQMDIMAQAEDYGFDSVWPAEHHFREYGHCATPALTLAALADRTKKIRLGTGVVVLPLNHPVRVAEDYAFLDTLSNGRVDLGIGRGYQPHEYQGYGVDQARSRDIFRESVEIIQKARTEASFSYHGEFYNFDNLSVYPRRSSSRTRRCGWPRSRQRRLRSADATGSTCSARRSSASTCRPARTRSSRTARRCARTAAIPGTSASAR